ncbi:MAG: hypothetical protein DRR16_15725 [Candidatus Parabeggiatoa sp. nov. 3]|nr:MAG: hypothetical protein DRQ99_20850 [Gammaproteobacteria bacterium]RKZ84068.1 MAG: hypothetical protein DRR16_15725 [Gammaproteobacteria bacterium]
MKQKLLNLTPFLSSILSKNSKMDGRIIVLLFLITYFSMIYISSFVMPYVQFWTYLGVPSMSPSFADLRDITSALECYRQGFDPLIHNPCDPWNRPMNYPRLWLGLSSLGLDQSHTFILGILQAILFYACIFIIIIKRLSVSEGLFYGLILCSPAVMLAVERGNNDLMIFVFLSLSVFLMQKRRILPYFFILMASILKLYPIVSIMSALREDKKRAIIIMLMVGTLFMIYMIYTWQDVILIGTTVPRSANLSYGSRVLFDGLNPIFQSISGLGIPEHFRTLFSFMAVLFVLVASYLATRLAFIQTHTQNKLITTQYIDSFRIGSIIYIGTFIIGNNWDYRLIFLILTLPQLFAWFKIQNPLSQCSVFLLIAILFTMWASFFAVWFSGLFSFVFSLQKTGNHLVFLIEEIINWLIFGCLISILLSTLPDWLKTLLRIETPR